MRAMRLIIIQDIYSQRAVRLKTVEMYCDFCCEDLVFSKVYVLITFLLSNLIKRFLNNFVYISHFTYVKFPLYYACFRSMNVIFKVALKYSGVNCTFLQGNENIITSVKSNIFYNSKNSSFSNRDNSSVLWSKLCFKVSLSRVN